VSWFTTRLRNVAGGTGGFAFPYRPRRGDYRPAIPPRKPLRIIAAAALGLCRAYNSRTRQCGVHGLCGILPLASRDAVLPVGSGVLGLAVADHHERRANLV
jgi:hypothetical protein